MEKEQRVDYLPLGSIVILKGGTQKVVINSRGLVSLMTEPSGFFDYGGSVYPQGIVGDSILYFNHCDIAKVVFKGYTDEDDAMMVDNINEWYAKSQYERADLEAFRNKKG